MPRKHYAECGTVDQILATYAEHGDVISAVARAYDLGMFRLDGFKHGDKVEKITGHRFNGTIIGGGITSKGEVRLMTELEPGPNAEGLLHIHSPNQLKKVG